jgi:hypothetical protein
MPLRDIQRIQNDARQLKDAAEQISAETTARLQFATELHELVKRAADQTQVSSKSAVDRASDAISATDPKLAIDHTIQARGALSSAIQTATSLTSLVPTGDPKDEWKECRLTIDRLDKVLVELRKTGVGIITAILGAAAFLLNTPGSGTNPPPAAPPEVKLSIFGIICLLIVAVFTADRFHQIWLGSAVKRAIELETRLGYEISSRLKNRVSVWQATALGIGLYMALLVAAAAIFWISLDPKQLGALDGTHYTLLGIFAAALVLLIVFSIARSEK